MSEHHPAQNASSGAPDETEREELLRFAETLKASRPQLSDAAMNNIAQAMRDEMALQKPGTTWPGLAAAAVVFLLLTAGLFSAALMLPKRGPSTSIPVVEKEPERDLERGRLALEKLEAESNLQNRLALLPEINQHCTEAQLTPDARYLLSLHLLQPHLTWHETYDVRPLEKVDKIKQVAKEKEESGLWKEAHTGDAWMISDADRARAREEALQRVKKPGQQEQLATTAAATLFWRISDPAHKDVSRAVALLNGVKGGQYQVAARRWIENLAHNNTVITFDICGTYKKNADAKLVVDTRCVDSLSLKLYRVRKPDPLLASAQRVGRDFIFRDYGLDEERMLMQELMAQRGQLKERTDRPFRIPQLDARDLVTSWTVNISDLKQLSHRYGPYWEDDEEFDDAEAQYFGDACEDFRERLQKSYLKDVGLSSWQGDRILSIPAKALSQDGAYILVAESNGQRAYAPVLVNALSLTMRRCRDGVFTLVSDPDGKQPMAGAKILAADMVGDAVSDKSGAAFARVFAAGEKPIVAWSGDRCAIGGFGKLFEGIYRRDFDHYGMNRLHALREVQKIEDTQVAQLYADRHVVAAYTDRPTYRPGQDVQFKLIVRKLQTEQKRAIPGVEKEFRAEDFELSSQLELPAITTLKYDVINPRGRSVAEGQLDVNDFGTAAGKFSLNSEESTGNYALRVWIKDTSYIVPDAFAVKYYRRSNFEVDVTGVPETIKPRQVLKLQTSARYYFGKPVASGRVETRIVRQSDHQLLAEAAGELSNGAGELELTLPDVISNSQFIVIATVTDESGRAVSKTLPCRSAASNAKVPTLSELPRFVALGETFKVHCDARELTSRLVPDDEKKKPIEQRFKAENSIASVSLNVPGWHTLSTGKEAFDIFVYGGTEAPYSSPVDLAEAGKATNQHRWVNLSNYEFEEDQDDSYPTASDLYALFDRHYVRSGEKLRLLVYAPFKRARLLFTIEGRTVSDYQVLWSDSKSCFHVVELPAKARYAPNFYLQGRVLAGEGESEMQPFHELAKALEQLVERDEDGEDPRWCRIDVIANATTVPDKLKVQVQPDRFEYRPGETVNVAIQVSDLDGNPREAEVSLSAVDESIYAFGEDRSSLIAQSFERRNAPERYYRKTWRSSTGNRAAVMQQMMDKLAQAARLADMQKALEQAQKSLASSIDLLKPTPLPSLGNLGQMPAGTVPLGYLRTDFRETAAWQPQLRSDKNGKITTSFKLPDSLTAWRLNAVGLTRQTELGSARATFRTRQPLAVQLFLPRFAVEKDKLQLTAIIHNDGDAPRTCQSLWKISGARVESWIEPAVGTAINAEGQSMRCTAPITVPPHGTARAAIMVEMSSPGTLTVMFSATEGADIDGEQRDIPVYPLGRSREVALNGSFQNETSVSLPAGFVADDLRISFARGSASQALSGIGYLVEYPYGCVEQTMSRFLPTVMVAHATRNGPVQLPADIQQKLPDVLSKGLARLYNFQHTDGGWGWWEKDATSNQMSVYVFYGLARCASTGTKVDADCMSRAAEYVLTNLRNGELKKNPGPFLHDSSTNNPVDLESTAWLALALAGKAPVDELKQYAAQSLKNKASNTSRCNLALACKIANLNDLSGELFKTVQPWQPNNTMELSLKLRTETAFVANDSICNQLAESLLSQKTDNRWKSTRETSAAIEALSEQLAKMQLGEAAQAYRIEARGREIFVADAAGLKKVFHSVKTSGELVRGEELPLKLIARCPEAVHYSINATGTQRLDKIEPLGTNVRLLRSYSKLDGSPLKQPLAAGEFVAVKLELTLTEPQSYVIVEDRLPAGWEVADDQLSGTAARLAANVEFRDDRVCAFFPTLSAGKHELTYYLRAETPGKVNVLPGCAYPMYSDKIRGETGASSLEVK